MGVPTRPTNSRSKSPIKGNAVTQLKKNGGCQNPYVHLYQSAFCCCYRGKKKVAKIYLLSLSCLSVCPQLILLKFVNTFSSWLKSDINNSTYCLQLHLLLHLPHTLNYPVKMSPSHPSPSQEEPPLPTCTKLYKLTPSSLTIH